MSGHSAAGPFDSRAICVWMRDSATLHVARAITGRCWLPKVLAMEISMLIEMRKVADIKFYPQNPRRNDHAVAAVAASIRKFGFRQPLVLDEDGVIIVGSTRFKAAVSL